MRCLSAAVTAVLLASVVIARAEQLPLRSYTVADGLAQNTVNRIVRDRRGFLWFCTAEGLSRFDGYAFTNYGIEHGLPYRVVTDFLQTRGGQSFVGTYAGLARFDPVAKDPARFFSLVGKPMPVTSLREGPSGKIWVGTTDGLYQLVCDRSGCNLVPADFGTDNSAEERIVGDAIEDRRGNVWVATSHGLYVRRPDGSTAHFTTRDGLPDDFLHTLYEDSHAQLWVGSREGGFFRLDTSGPSPRVAERFVYVAPDGQATKWIYELIESRDGALWFGTNRGLIELTGEPGRRRLRAFSTRNGLSHYEITTLAEDIAGNLWLGSSSAGAMKLTRDGLVSYGERDGIVSVNGVFGDGEGGVCFRAYVLGQQERSVFEGAPLNPLRPFDTYIPRFGRFDGENFTWMLPEGLARAHVGWVGEGVTLRARSGEWWIGSDNALLRFPKVSFAELKKARPIAYPAAQVYRIFEDSSGNIWFSTLSSTGARLMRWEKSSGVVIDLHDVPGLAGVDDVARSFGEDAARNVWIGFRSGVARFRDGRFTMFTTGEGLPEGGVNDIHLDEKGRLWLASTASGVLRSDHPDDVNPRFRAYGTVQGLSSNLVEVLTEDLQGRIYAGTGRGLDRLDPETERVRHFTSADGLAQGRFLDAYRDSTGVLWLALTNGLSRFTPQRDRSVSAPEVVIEAVSVAGRRQPLSALGQREVVVPDLTSGPNGLQFNFAALNFGLGQSPVYQYRLDGAPGAEWSAPASQRAIQYANLRAGRYRFEVRAMDPGGAPSGRAATVRFGILPPLWQRWWFVLLAACAVVLTAFALYRYRVLHLIEVARIRSHIAADLHDDIGANLTRIAILSEVTRRQLGHDGEEGALPAIARISRESVSAMSDIVWAINPERDTLVDVIRRMRSHAEETFASDHTTVSFNVIGADDNVKLGAVVRRDLFLTFKEALNNSARHSGCSRVDIELRVDGRWLDLTVTDNGVGFDAEPDGSGEGLTSMRRRAARMGGTIAIESKPGEGTNIKLRVPCRVTRWGSLAANPT